MDSPTVSVLMSVFNGQAFLAGAIESILAQALREFEFLVIDDGSTDRTAEILAAYASRDRRMRIVRHENRGRAESLNIGIGLATGKYIARMDADDVAMPCRLAEQMDFMERHPEVGLLGGGVEVINTTGQTITTFRPPSEDSEIRSMLMRHNAFFHPTVAMRKEVALAAGGYRKPLLDADDYDLWLRIAERSRVANLSNCVLQYRIHPNQVSIRNMRHQVQCVLAARAAASIRRRGSADPLSQVKEITPQLLDTLGVSRIQVQETLAGIYGFWMPIIRESEPEAALQVIDGLAHLQGAGPAERSALANAWLTAARIHYRKGRPIRTLVAVARAVFVRPIVVGRPLKRILTRFATAVKD